MTKSFKQAQDGLSLIQDAILDILADAPSGLKNSEITKALGLHSDQEGRNKDYLAWSILGIMMKSGKIQKIDGRYARVYKNDNTQGAPSSCG